MSSASKLTTGDRSYQHGGWEHAIAIVSLIGIKGIRGNIHSHPTARRRGRAQAADGPRDLGVTWAAWTFLRVALAKNCQRDFARLVGRVASVRLFNSPSPITLFDDVTFLATDATSPHPPSPTFSSCRANCFSKRNAQRPSPNRDPNRWPTRASMSRRLGS